MTRVTLLDPNGHHTEWEADSITWIEDCISFVEYSTGHRIQLIPGMFPVVLRDMK